MKAVYQTEFGDSSKLKIGDVEAPVPKTGEVLIKVDHTSVNPVDWKIREGMLKGALPHEFPLIPGWDAAGTIAELGAGVGSFAKGDAVYAYARRPVVQFGTYAEYTVVDQSALAKKPRSLSFAEAASVPLVALTAWQSLVDVANVRSGDTTLVLAGAGGVGSFGVQFAKHLGARVIATASARNHDYVKSLGADHVIDYTGGDTVAKVRALGLPVTVVFDCAGGTSLEDGWQLIESGGRLVSIVDSPSTERAAQKNVRAQYVFVAPNGAQLSRIGDLIDAGVVKIPEVTVKSLREAAAAQDENQKRHVRGKVSLRVDL